MWLYRPWPACSDCRSWMILSCTTCSPWSWFPTRKMKYFPTLSFLCSPSLIRSLTWILPRLWWQMTCVIVRILWSMKNQVMRRTLWAPSTVTKVHTIDWRSLLLDTQTHQDVVHWHRFLTVRAFLHVLSLQAEVPRTMCPRHLLYCLGNSLVVQPIGALAWLHGLSRIQMMTQTLQMMLRCRSPEELRSLLTSGCLWIRPPVGDVVRTTSVYTAWSHGYSKVDHAKAI